MFAVLIVRSHAAFSSAGGECGASNDAMPARSLGSAGRTAYGISTSSSTSSGLDSPRSARPRQLGRLVRLSDVLSIILRIGVIDGDSRHVVDEVLIRSVFRFHDTKAPSNHAMKSSR